MENMDLNNKVIRISDFRKPSTIEKENKSVIDKLKSKKELVEKRKHEEDVIKFMVNVLIHKEEQQNKYIIKKVEKSDDIVISNNVDDFEEFDGQYLEEDLVLMVVEAYLNSEDDPDSEILDRQEIDRRSKFNYHIAYKIVTEYRDEDRLRNVCRNICKNELRKRMNKVRYLRNMPRTKKNPNPGLAFYYIDREFKDYKDLMEVFARAFVQEIFGAEDLDLEGYLHKKYQDKSKIEGKIDKCILDYIAERDTKLCEYLILRKVKINKWDILSQVHEKIKQYVKTWDIYESSKANEKYDILADMLDTYSRDYADYCIDYCNTTAEEIMVYVAIKKGILLDILHHESCSYIIDTDICREININHFDNLYRNIIDFQSICMEINEIYDKCLGIGKYKEPIKTFEPVNDYDVYQISEKKVRKRCEITSIDFKNKKINKEN